MTAAGSFISRPFMSFFRFCCRLFCLRNDSRLCRTGLSDCKHVGTRLKEHEASKKHMTSVHSWAELTMRLPQTSAMNHLKLHVTTHETLYRSRVIQRFLAIVELFDTRFCHFVTQAARGVPPPTSKTCLSCNYEIYKLPLSDKKMFRRNSFKAWHARCKDK